MFMQRIFIPLAVIVAHAIFTFALISALPVDSENVSDDEMEFWRTMVHIRFATSILSAAAAGYIVFSLFRTFGRERDGFGSNRSPGRDDGYDNRREERLPREAYWP